MNHRYWLISIVAALLLLTSTWGYAALSNNNETVVPSVEAVGPGNWEWINYGPDGGSFSPQTQINKETVAYLEMKWIYPFQSDIETTFPNSVQEGASAPPIIVDGVVYVAKNKQDVVAVDAKTGELVWYSDVITQAADFDAWLAEFPYMQGQYGHTHAVNYYADRNELILSSAPCWLKALDAADGSLAWQLTPELLCGTQAEMGNPLGAMGTFKSKGYMSAIQNHPPQIIDDIVVWPSFGASGRGGRSSLIGIDISNTNAPVEVYRNWLMPPGDGSQPTWAQDQCDRTNGQVWYFEYPKYIESGGSHLALNCRDAPADAVANDWINMKPGTPHFGEVHTASAFSVVWGNMPYSEKTGLVYMGTGDVGPYPNSTLKFGPNLFGSSLIAVDARTGELAWAMSALPHDLWDMDCSWGGALRDIGSQEIYIASCKNGIVYGLDSATGEPIWIIDPKSIARNMQGWNYGGDSSLGQSGNGGAQAVGPDACCDITFAHMNKDWMNQNSPDCAAGESNSCTGIAVGPNAWAHIESDMAIDDKHIYMGVQNSPRRFQIKPVTDFGNQGSTIEQVEPKNSTIHAFNWRTGVEVWSTYIEGVSYRGGVMVSGGVVYAYASDGNMYMLDADTGEILNKKLFGIPVSVMPTIGADSDGNYKVFLYIGGGGGFLFSSTALPGSLAAFGNPDQLPAGPITIIEEVEVIVEREIEVERIVEKEIIIENEVIIEKEVPVEVEVIVEREIEVTVTEEVISPISYVAIGLGVILVVVAGVIYSRSTSK